MVLLAGVYFAKRKDGTPYYRSSITFRNKHISLGSFPTEELAHKAYVDATTLISSPSLRIHDYKSNAYVLSFHKWVVLVNYRDNNIYSRNPLYLRNRYFEYYFDKHTFLKFDVDDLFYYSNHKIMKRGGHLFVQDFGMQVNILSRYGIKNFAVVGRDYRFVNSDPTDYRYGNIELINKYYGVTKVMKKGIPLYMTKIHINGDYIVGRYATEVEAAIAYNKAVELLSQKGVTKNFSLNYIMEVDEIAYASIYSKLRLSKKIRDYQG